MGCDEVYNGDTVYVEGYNETFRATIYENALYSYIPW
jgi:sortase (surface protein transpeptidase)